MTVNLSHTFDLLAAKATLVRDISGATASAILWVQGFLVVASAERCPGSWFVLDDGSGTLFVTPGETEDCDVIGNLVPGAYVCVIGRMTEHHGCGRSVMTAMLMRRIDCARNAESSWITIVKSRGT